MLTSKQAIFFLLPVVTVSLFIFQSAGEAPESGGAALSIRPLPTRALPQFTHTNGQQQQQQSSEPASTTTEVASSRAAVEEVEVNRPTSTEAVGADGGIAEECNVVSTPHAALLFLRNALIREEAQQLALKPPADRCRAHLDAILHILEREASSEPQGATCAITVRRVLKANSATTNFCAAQPLNVFVDLGSRTIDQTSNFVKHFPQAASYIVHAMEANPKFNPLYPPFIRQAVEQKKLRGMQYHNTAAGVVNDTLYLSDRSVGSSVVREEGAAGGKAVTRPPGSVPVAVVGFSEFLEQIIARRFDEVLLSNGGGGGGAKEGNDNCVPKSHVVVKMDIEKMEFAVLHQLLRTGAFSLIDDLLLECHYNTNKPKSSRNATVDIGKDDCESLVLRFNEVFGKLPGTAPFIAVLWNSVKTAKSSGYSRNHGGFFPT